MATAAPRSPCGPLVSGSKGWRDRREGMRSARQHHRGTLTSPSRGVQKSSIRLAVIGVVSGSHDRPCVLPTSARSFSSSAPQWT